MSWTLCLTFFFVKILLLANAMEEDYDFRPFLTISLPSSVKRDEVIKVSALVYNFSQKKLDVNVTLDNGDGIYENIDFENKVISKPKLTKSKRVQAHSTATIYFLIRPKVIGNIVLKFNASSLADFDSVHKTLKVVPEGITQYFNRAYFVNLKRKPELRYSFKLELPQDLVTDSQHIEVGAVGDIMGPVFNNLQNLVRMPTGCCEQTVSFLISNYLVMKYLMNSKRLTPTMEAKLRYNLDTGYRNLLNCRHEDGSFSSFGPSQVKEKAQNGSTWLTAYVVRFLSKLKEFRYVNEKIIEDGLIFLSKQQAKNGTFTEKGNYFPTSQINDITLTDAAILAFLQNRAYSNKYYREIADGVDFIAKNFYYFVSPYVDALSTYTLNKAKHAEARRIVSILQGLARTDLRRASFFRNISWSYSFDRNVEASSYNLLTLLDKKTTNVADVMSVVGALMAQRNSLGGFASTRDTDVALTALIKFAELANYEPARMDVDIVSKAKNETIKLTGDDGILYKSVELPPQTKLIKFTAKGHGAALVQIAYQYNTFKSQEGCKPSFTIKAKMLDSKIKRDGFEMLVCVSYVGEKLASNMALLEISAPSGYIIDDESLKELQKLERVGNTELQNSGSLLIVYFDYLYKNIETCLTVKALRSHPVAMQKPTSILLYDFYDTDEKAAIFYDVGVKLCDICDIPEECSKCK